MGRYTEKRDHYREFAIGLHRLIEALNIDDRRSQEYKDRVTVKARDLIRELLTDDEQPSNDR